ncbi:MAG TPA: hypothetical protein PKD83_04465 [Ignavibacteria bacterium]|nr:hypothetical protein [Ignavibacteria bacterium]
MISKRYNLIFTIVIFCATLFSSCLSVDRNIIINKDGSGSETMTISFDKIFYETMSSMTFLMDSNRVQGFLDSLYSDEVFVNETREKFESRPGINLLDIYSHKNEDLSNSFIVKYEFDSIKKIGSTVLSKFEQNNNPDSVSKDDSDTEIIFTREGENVLFSYNYLKEGAEGEINPDDSLANEVNKGMADMFKDGNITIEINFPYDVISSNADSTVGNTLKWMYSLSKTISKGEMKLEAVMKGE